MRYAALLSARYCPEGSWAEPVTKKWPNTPAVMKPLNVAAPSSTKMQQTEKGDRPTFSVNADTLLVSRTRGD